MPFILRNHAAPHEEITQTNSSPQNNEGELYSQAGWNPSAQDAVVVGVKYRLDGDGPNRAVKVTAIGAGLNAITYTREGLA